MRSVRDWMRVCARFAPVLLLVPMLLAGCGGSPPLAKVGSRTITVADFEDAARNNTQQYPGSPDSAKAALLDDLVKRELMLEQATKLHLVPDSTLERVRKQTADRLAVEALMRKLVPADVAVSDAEVRALYDQRQNESHLFLIFAADEAQAKQAAQQIDQGQPFAAVAGRVNNPTILPTTGDLGFVQPGSMPSPLDEWLRTAPLGKTMGPAAAPGSGWFVAKITERRPAKQQPLEMMKPTLTQMIKVRKTRVLQQKAYNGIRDQYQIQVDPSGPQAMFQRLQQTNAGLAHSMGAQPLSPTPNPHDSTTVLAHYQGADGKTHAYTMSDALKDMTDPAAQRFDPNSMPMLRQWIEAQLVQRALRVEAVKRHVAEEPDVVKRARAQVENELLQQVYVQQVASRVTRPDSADVRAAFQRHAAQLIRLDSAKLRVVTLRDSAAAATLVRGLSGPGTLRAAAARVPGAAVVEKDIRYPTQEPFWNFQQGNLMGAQPGDPRGPFRNESGSWIVYELVSKQQGQQSYDKLEPQYMNALQAEAAEVERDRVLSQYTDSLRHAFPVTVYSDRLKRIPWPVPPAKG